VQNRETPWRSKARFAGGDAGFGRTETGPGLGPGPDHNKNSLALGELEALAGAFLTVLLAFVLPGVTGEEASLFEGRAKLCVESDQRAGKTKANGPGLPGDAAAMGQHQNIETITLFGENERQFGRNTGAFRGEVVLKCTAIDRELARSGTEENTGDAGFAATGSQVLLNFL